MEPRQISVSTGFFLKMVPLIFVANYYQAWTYIFAISVIAPLALLFGKHTDWAVTKKGDISKKVVFQYGELLFANNSSLNKY
ncbi:hypothetical protein [Xenorhabdus bovienii]|uniref:Uncharacterized protein n=2 Tax=Xenorhabdus bovienii TaxID=40576 RepID=A0A077QEF3_XENBV|nr:hypothetical protein [Xenorhabdus bovienii]MDE1476903.1 hypothetical protein [Xenorhabdus bovienii]MDE1481913.1 hypothetical protein [Xenorhabdus bovienii]MDE9432306.1 hypothetical protein [Xenorhabdus bovienii]MDE9456918.1 hypothetical protein [Xenorhabdus bovienii]MDE9462064.1 hypothetical protein [Xenorhabdus bovienii]